MPCWQGYRRDPNWPIFDRQYKINKKLFVKKFNKINNTCKWIDLFFCQSNSVRLLPNLSTAVLYCCAFQPAFGCCPHPKAGRDTFFLVSSINTLPAYLQVNSRLVFTSHDNIACIIQKIILSYFWRKTIYKSMCNFIELWDQYAGFKAVYRYIPNPLDNLPDIGKCTFEAGGHQVISFWHFCSIFLTRFYSVPQALHDFKWPL